MGGNWLVVSTTLPNAWCLRKNNKHVCEFYYCGIIIIMILLQNILYWTVARISEAYIILRRKSMSYVFF